VKDSKTIECKTIDKYISNQNVFMKVYGLLADGLSEKPKFEYKCNGNCSFTSSNFNQDITDVTAMTITDPVSVTSSFGGGMPFTMAVSRASVNGVTLKSLAKSGGIVMNVCELPCIFDEAASIKDNDYVCKTPAIHTKGMLAEQDLKEEQIRFGTAAISGDSQFTYWPFDLEIKNFLPSKTLGATDVCFVEWNIPSGWVMKLTRFRYFMKMIGTDRPAFNGFKITGTKVDASVTTIMHYTELAANGGETLSAELHEGWNKVNIESGNQEEYVKLRFEGPVG
jgi:hypothetical protein